MFLGVTIRLIFHPCQNIKVCFDVISPRWKIWKSPSKKYEWAAGDSNSPSLSSPPHSYCHARKILAAWHDQKYFSVHCSILHSFVFTQLPLTYDMSFVDIEERRDVLIFSHWLGHALILIPNLKILHFLRDLQVRGEWGGKEASRGEVVPQEEKKHSKKDSKQETRKKAFGTYSLQGPLSERFTWLQISVLMEYGIWQKNVRWGHILPFDKFCPWYWFSMSQMFLTSETTISF